MLIALASLVVAIIALEVGLRWADGVPLLPRKTFGRERVHHPFFKSNTGATYHRTLGWSTVPNIRAQGMNTDEYGGRLPSPHPRPLPIDGVLVTGASFSYGGEVSDEASWPAQLEGLIGTPVMNIGAGCWGPDQTILAAEEMLDVIRPTVVILGFVESAICYAERRDVVTAFKPYFTVTDGVLVQHNNPVPLFIGLASEIGWLRAVVERSYLVFWVAQWLKLLRWAKPDPDAEWVTPRGTGVEITCRLLDRLKATAEQRGFRLVVVMQYGGNGFHVATPPEEGAKVIAYARAAGIDAIDEWDELRRIHDEDLERFRSLWVIQPDGQTLGHPSEAGNGQLAERLAALLKHAPQRPAAIDALVAHR